MLEPNLYLVVGLGNPGERYQFTRHNVGFLVADKIACSFSIPFCSSNFGAIYGRGAVASVPTILAKPMGYMNRSGPPIDALLTRFDIPAQRLLVIHDDIDLELGRLKIKDRGGHGGHKGIQSVLETLGKDCFIRLRIGVGRPATGVSASEHVLDAFSPADQSIFEQVVDQACNTVQLILCNGAKTAMNTYNIKKPHPGSKDKTERRQC
jgi:PTH1 family peptidyl-tRNA hydrolase